MYNVLIIDDELSILSLIKEILTRFGYNAETASGGLEGLSVFDEGSFDVVITDIRMPDVDGHAVVRHIRGSGSPDTPIIGVSGTPWLLDNGEFDSTISKPFSIHTLLNVIEKLTSNHSGSERRYANASLSI